MCLQYQKKTEKTGILQSDEDRQGCLPLQLMQSYDRYKGVIPLMLVFLPRVQRAFILHRMVLNSNKTIDFVHVVLATYGYTRISRLSD